MKQIICAIFFFMSIHFDIDAQDLSALGMDIKSEDIINYYSNASLEEKAVIDSLFSDFVEQQKAQQINSICGIPFGASHSDAMKVLRNKYGEPYSLSNDNHIVYKDVKYAGINFDSIHFLFQPGDLNSYFNACFFIKDAKSKSKAIEIMDLYKEVLGKKYQLYEATDESGFKIYGGGISPLWNGDWLDYMSNISNGKYFTAIRTDVIEYDEDLGREFGGIKYGVRIIYGPYEYVKEEF